MNFLLSFSLHQETHIIIFSSIFRPLNMAAFFVVSRANTKKESRAN